MDLRQLTYIVSIEEEGTISRAAEKLYITQSALNQQLLKLERELGTPLFERRKNGMAPTYAGKVYLDACRRILNIRQDTYRIIADISDEKSGEISIAYTPERGVQMFSELYPHFHSRYPNITFRICEGRTKDMEQLLIRREVRLAFCVHTDSESSGLFDYRDLKQEPIVLAVPETFPQAAGADRFSYETLPETDIRRFLDVPFVLSSESTLIRRMTDRLFEQLGSTPTVLFESSSTSTLVNLVRKQICCAFLPGSYIDPTAPVRYFTVSPDFRWTQSVMSLKGSYLTGPEQYLVTLAKLHANNQLPPPAFPGPAGPTRENP